MEVERPENADEAVLQFCSVTDAAPHVAENYLLAHDWDVERAVDFYFLHPPGGGGGGGAGGGGGGGIPPLAAGDDDEDMRAALEASMGQEPRRQEEAPPLGPPRDVIEIPDDDDYEEEGEEGALQSLAARRAAALEAHRAAELLREEELMEMGERAMRAAGLPADLAVAGRGFGRRRGESGPGGPSGGLAEAAALAADDGGFGSFGGGRASGSGGGGGGGGGAGSSLDIDLPEGVDVEEARMLEAAMLGVPYTGRIPTFSPAAPVDPGALEQRWLRREQDEAFEESLAADRAKQESAQMAARAAEEAAAAQAAAEAAEEAKRDEAARALAALLERKAAALPAEPKAGEPATLALVVRLPDGTRCGRRFRHGDALRAAFDFVDVHTARGATGAGGVANGSGGGASGGGGEGSLRPGSYRLVTQFPRRKFEEGQGGTFVDAGLTSDTAAFVELL
ncbi:hypothetical protein Rsub_11454 [Raphidocelis subcapitata]|uniref:UBX domain-containing protein n=1 Tax=Raphidocelis subcapitata TaxID=307507 RepID=A0A2V0PLW1_9CHLO|nr:hypothetical protein Rsub_11454 [Raphidocelis subcapitata]|eukprot:GBF98850.1 hypothetical protein Rsub_11454 [Raphidocelis subcapitata]